MDQKKRGRILRVEKSDLEEDWVGRSWISGAYITKILTSLCKYQYCVVIQFHTYFVSSHAFNNP